LKNTSGLIFKIMASEILINPVQQPYSVPDKVREETIPSQIAFQHSRVVAREPMPFHYHRIFEIYYCQTDGIRYLVGNRFYEMNQGDLLVLNNFDIHHSLPVPGIPYERSLILFPPEIIQPRKGEKTDLLDCFRRHGKNYNHVRHLNRSEQTAFETIHKKGMAAMKIKRYGSDVERRIILEEALLFVNRLFLNRPSFHEEGTIHYDNRVLARATEIMEYVDKHIGEDLSLERLASRFNSSPNGLNRLFKKAGSFTVHQYIMNRRIQYAQLYLSEGHSVTSVAYDVGYNDLAHFIRIFKEKTGMTPGQYGRQSFDYLESLSLR
jgi:AraC-like DNA-binding protein